MAQQKREEHLAVQGHLRLDQCQPASAVQGGFWTGWSQQGPQMTSSTSNGGSNLPAPEEDAPDLDGDEFPDFLAVANNIADATAPGTSPPASSPVGGNFANTTERISQTGSGLVFVNSYGANVTATFRNEIVAAENYL